MGIARAAGKRRKPVRDEAGELPIAPMIDVVFLLLIYFLVSSTIQPQEADLSFALPGVVPLDRPMELPDEQVIQVLDTGQPVVNDYPYDAPERPAYLQLAAMLSRFRQASEAMGSQARVTIAPSPEAAHEAVVKTLDACARAGLADVSFALSRPAGASP